MPAKPRLTALALEDRSLPALLLGLEADGLTLVAFDSAAPGAVLTTKGVTGLEAGATLVGIDYRPSNGLLYGVSSDSRLYTIDAATGAATAVGVAFKKSDGTAVPLDGTAFGVDFNPAADKLRIVSNTRQNLRVNPADGIVAAVDPSQAYDPDTFEAVVGGDVPLPQLVATAYTKNLDPAGTKTVTTQYVIDSNLSLLSTQGGPDGDPSPNTGVLFPVDLLGFTPAAATGFDIEAGTDTAFVTAGDKLYTISLTTAATQTTGTLPAGFAFKDVAVQPPAAGAGTFTVGATTATFDPATRGPLVVTVTRTGGSSVAATIDYATGGGTAVPNTDYLPASGTLSFAPGETEKQITLLLPAGPGPVAPEKTFELTLSNPTGGAALAVTDTVTVTIPAVTGPVFAGTLNVDQAGYSFLDDRGPVTVTVTRTGGLTETASVGYITADGTATAASDYVPAAGVLTFAPGETSKTVQLTLPAGTPAPGPAETFLFRLFNPSAQATLGGQSEATITIPAVAAPDASTLGLSSATFAFPADRSPVTVTVTREGSLAGTVTVDYATAAGTAAAGTDFVAQSGTLTFGPNEASKTITLAVPAGSTAPAAARTFTLTLSNPTGGGAVLGAIGTATVTIPAATPPAGGLPAPVFQPNGQPAINQTRAAALGTPQFSVGGANGGVTVLNPDQTTALTLTALAGFTGSVRTAVADFTGDGIADVAAAAGPGAAPRVVVIDGATQKTLFTAAPFEESFTGGAFVAVGDLNGDGVPDLVVTPDEGGGPRVRAFSGVLLAQGKSAPAAQLADFFGIEDTAFRGGARAGVGDLNGDGRADLIVAAGFGGGPRVALFDGKTLGNPLAAGQFPPKLRGDFFVFEDTLRNGVFVSAGDVSGDGRADLIVGAGPGGGPRVSVFDAKTLLTTADVNAGPRFANFFAGDPANRDGVRVAAKDLDNDSRADLVTAAGTGRAVTAYLGKGLPADPATAAFTYNTPDALTGGVFVG